MTSAAEIVVQLACDRGLVSAAQVAATGAKLAANAASAPAPEQVFAALVADGELREADALALLAAEFSLPLVSLVGVEPTAETLACLPRELAERYRVFPLERRGAVLRLAIADPLATGALDTLAHLLRLSLEPVLASAGEIDRAIARHCPGALVPVAADGAPPAERGATSAGGDVTVVRLAERLLGDALARRASDLHLEPFQHRLRVRCRVDGVLHEMENVAKELQLPLVSRFKLLAGLSLAEKRLPQDGRFRFSSGSRAVDLRVSCVPSVHGESLVLRVLDARELQPDLARLGLGESDRAMLERWIGRPDGLVLVTGPTGSGKTTTLYSCLQRLNDADRKLITVEDPVEYRLPGVNQVSVRPETGLTFATALRAILRQSPNVVMIGEIRDRETAEIAVQAALTGHLVFSTLHTNDAAGAVVRLLDLGVPPFLLAAALRGVVAQRLVRRVCPSCRRVACPSPADLQLLGPPTEPGEPADFRAGAGCEECDGSGFRGRLGLFELLEIDAAAAAQIHAGADVSALRAVARAAGRPTLRRDGWRKVRAGCTVVAEVVAATTEDAD